MEGRGQVGNSDNGGEVGGMLHAGSREGASRVVMSGWDCGGVRRGDIPYSILELGCCSDEASVGLPVCDRIFSRCLFFGADLGGIWSGKGYPMRELDVPAGALIGLVTLAGATLNEGMAMTSTLLTCGAAVAAVCCVVEPELWLGCETRGTGKTERAFECSTEDFFALAKSVLESVEDLIMVHTLCAGSNGTE